MIKLVGFNISGIPKRNNRSDRRNNTKRMSKEHRQSDTGKWVNTKQRSETQRRERPKAVSQKYFRGVNGVTAADPTTNEENYRVPRMGRLLRPCLGTERPRDERPRNGRPDARSEGSANTNPCDIDISLRHPSLSPPATIWLRKRAQTKSKGGTRTYTTRTPTRTQGKNCEPSACHGPSRTDKI